VVGTESKQIQNYYVLKGDIIDKPEYGKSEIPEYSGNPLIEALPPVLDFDNLMEHLTVYPELGDDDVNKRNPIRFQLIGRIRDFYQPLPIAGDTYNQFSELICRGYLARNPMKNDYMDRLRTINEVKKQPDDVAFERLSGICSRIRSTASTFSIIGISGIGKTTLVEKILSLYPQLIYHTEYKGIAMTRAQVVWLKIDCPHDGSLKTLCRSFFSAVDNVLGTTNYTRSFGNPRNTTAMMMIHMAYVSALHSIGVLVIDEIQHLMASRGTSQEEMLNFFVTLVNVIGIPVVTIGTFKAMKVLSRDFRQARRVGTDGMVIWDRMKNDDMWEFFTESMWEFQYLKNYTPFSQKLSDALYDLSQGITSVAVALFMLCQKHALGNEEKITVNGLKKVAGNDLKMIQSMIDALRNNNIRALAQYEDLVVDINQLMKEYRPRALL